MIFHNNFKFLYKKGKVTFLRKENQKPGLLTGPGQALDFWTYSNEDFCLNFARFGSKNICLMKCLDDSAWFLLEKLKKHVILTKNLDI